MLGLSSSQVDGWLIWSWRSNVDV